MDHLFRIQERLALQDPEGRRGQKELARAHIRSGRKAAAYKVYRQSGLLAERDPEAVSLVASMADEQYPVIKECPDRWLADRVYPDFPTAHSHGLYEAVSKRLYIDSLSIKDQIGDDILEQVADIPHVLGLRLSDERFRGDLQLLRDSSIEGLFLATVNPKRSPLHALEELQNLRRLKLVSQRLTENLAQRVNHLRGLEKLELTLLQGSLSALQQIQNRSIQELSVSACKLGDTDLQCLEGAYALTELEIHEGDFTQAGLDVLSGLPRLSRLSFEKHRGLGRVDLASLGDLDKLESLTLRRCRFQESQLSFLPSLKQLKALSIVGNRQIGDGLIDGLLHLDHLESLDLTSSGISDAGLTKLASLSSLRVLFFGDCQLSLDALEALTALPELKILLWDHHVYFSETDPPLSEYLQRLRGAS